MSTFWRITLDTNPEDCNLSCTMCEEHSEHSDFMKRLYERTGIKRRRMPFDMVRKVMEEAAAMGVREIIPSTMGEPLLYRQFDELLELAAQLGMKVNLTTNGTFPKRTVEDWAARIVPVTSDVKISWNGATKSTAESVMKGLKFEQAVSNAERFIRVRDAHHAVSGHYCRVTFQLTFMQNNMHELPEIIRLAAKLGVDRVKGHHLWAHFEEIEQLSFKNSPEAIERWNHIVDQAVVTAAAYPRPDGTPVQLENITLLAPQSGHEVPHDHMCPFLGKELWVSATGDISPCCAPDDLRRSLGDFGNVNERSLSEVVADGAYQGLMRDYRDRPLCRTCNMRKPC
ncbi:MAG: radical SAM protein [Flavobacteriales bacterium]|nr:MAG: radical SAM protein [Flavobacteriales bacterium]